MNILLWLRRRYVLIAVSRTCSEQKKAILRKMIPSDASYSIISSSDVKFVVSFESKQESQFRIWLPMSFFLLTLLTSMAESDAIYQTRECSLLESFQDSSISPAGK
jgi:hypothetical protein